MSAAADSAQEMLERLRVRPWGIAVVVLDGDDTAIVVDEGQDPLDEDTLFEIGSITKTVTGGLLASCVVAGETSLETTVGDIVGDRAGATADVQLVALATHRSGLPRLPPNLSLEDVDLGDPYADYDEARLLEALQAPELHPPVHEYSNFGFMLLGWLLAQITGQDYGSLAAERLFRPMGLPSARVGAPDGVPLPGYEGPTAKSWWRQPLPGAGAVAMSAKDLAGYLRAHVDEDPGTPLGRALTMATTRHAAPPDATGLAWADQGGGWWHNGGTGGFRSFAGFHRPTRTAVGLLANSSDAGTLDMTGMATLTTLARERSADPTA